MQRSIIMVLLVLLTLACNFPGFPDTLPPPASSATPDAEVPADTTPASEAQTTPAPFETLTEPSEQPSPTPSLTATATITATSDVTPTPGTVQPGPPLAFQEPAWELVEWHQIPGTSDWEGTIRIHITGGRPPYRSQLEDQEIVDGLDVHARWRLCADMPATLRVWSADGQYAQTTIWVPAVGCPSE